MKVTGNKYCLNMWGPLQLSSPMGVDITPSGAKSQALLAMLAVANGRPCHRASLQDKLWSDRDHVHGRDSLKKCLSEIRKMFGKDATKLIHSKAGAISLNVEHFDIDIHSNAPRNPFASPEFLEGIVIRDEEFESWLCATRVLLESVAQIPHMPAVDEKTQRTRFSMSISPPVAKCSDSTASILGEIILDRLVLALKHCEIFEIFDNRLDASNDHSADVRLQIKFMAMAGDTYLSFIMHRVSDNAVVWSFQKTVEMHMTTDRLIQSLVIQIIDQISKVMLRGDVLGSDELNFAAIHALSGVDHMLRNSSDNLELSSQRLELASSIDPRSTYFAWQAFLSAFQMDNANGGDVTEVREIADYNAARALEIDPHNPLTRSLLTHVYSFVFRDYEKAASMIQPLEGTRPDTPMYYHSLAMLNYYTGNFTSARDAALQSRELGKFSTFSYAFSTSVCMIDAVTGDVMSAIKNGEHALALHRPKEKKFKPLLRYLSAVYALAGEDAKARQTWDALSAQNGEFNVKAIKQEHFPAPSESSRKLLKNGISKLNRLSA